MNRRSDLSRTSRSTFDADMTSVPRDLCDMPGPTWTSLHQDGLHNRNDTRRPHLGRICLPTLELTRSHWNVWSVARRPEDARSTTTDRLRTFEWYECKYGRHYRFGRCSSMSSCLNEDNSGKYLDFPACTESHPRPPNQDPGYFGSMCWYLLQCSVVLPDFDCRGWHDDHPLGYLACTEGRKSQS